MKEIAESVTRAQVKQLVAGSADDASTVAEIVPREFRDDDAGYLAWLAAHPGGYVINIARNHNPSAARVHHASCRTISGQNPHGGAWTGPYVKICADSLNDLEQWAKSQVGLPIPSCGTCRAADHGAQVAAAEPTARAVSPSVSNARYEIHGPQQDSSLVQAWADDYIRFERLPPWQKQLRDEIRSRCQQLEPVVGQVLHATFFGGKLHNADVENLVLYNIDSFKVAGRNGIRFEHGAARPPPPGEGEYRCGYRYALTPRSDDFNHWRQGRTLASFDWTDLGSFASEKQLAQVWLALKRGEAEVGQAAASEASYGVRAQVRPPHRRQPVWGGLVKGIFDGVICALQAHTDRAVLPEVTARLATMLPATPEEIAEHLLDQRRAVLGVARRLVSPYQAGVKWDPCDHLCVAGELIAAEPVDDRWAIKGEIVELYR